MNLNTRWSAGHDDPRSTPKCNFVASDLDRGTRVFALLAEGDLMTVTAREMESICEEFEHMNGCLSSLEATPNLFVRREQFLREVEHIKRKLYQLRQRIESLWRIGEA